MSNETIGTLFTQDSCSPCFGVKSKLKKFGFAEDGQYPIVIKNISHDEDAFRECQRNEVRSTPAMKVGSEWLRSPLEILDWAKKYSQ